MKSFMNVFVFVLMLFFSPAQSHAQGTVQSTVTFDGSPVIPRGSGMVVNYYYEQGVTFRGVGTNDTFG